MWIIQLHKSNLTSEIGFAIINDALEELLKYVQLPKEEENCFKIKHFTESSLIRGRIMSFYHQTSRTINYVNLMRVFK